MNKDSITAKLRKKAAETKVSYNTVLSQFFYDEFLSLLSKSEYKDKFVLKGGILISSTLGIENRTTVDIDFMITGLQLEAENIKSVIEKIIGEKETVWFEITDLQPIRDENIYGGVRVFITGHLENIRQPFTLDIATGDPVTPEIQEIDYKTISDETIKLKAYPFETVLAEKLQTVLVRAELNGRCKDFYDIYMLVKLGKIDNAILKDAIKTTFDYRHTKIDKDEFLNTLERIKNDENFNTRWKNFVKKNAYVGDLTLDEALNCCREILMNLPDAERRGIRPSSD